ncbi:hypothetical protein MUK42_07371 [Musa troglodytarum]|uniref:Molybdate-anion transporter n=1 Tax=Musa troglodytarum TaxID=320322 RepID=A0A9E7HIB6_9LILI|nr:hypothetical protein MUK42_07371 [Musa troglodytarum]URE33730.1 hypothetical protein MUK42_07371 [Musa troglodytarum]
MEAFYWLLFGGLAAVVAALEMSKTNRDRASTSSAFNSFKNNYLLVYSLMMGSRRLVAGSVRVLPLQPVWIREGDIGRLFIAGFGSSMLFGTIVGSLADKQFVAGQIVTKFPTSSPEYLSMDLYNFVALSFALHKNTKIALLGAIQSLFEGSMYTFVFLWTPALSPNDEDIPHGFIFATFMLSSMLGSSIASRLLSRAAPKVESYMQLVFAIAAVTLLLPVITSFLVAPSTFKGGSISFGGCIQLFGFCIFEACVGIFWPSIMKMRSQYIPEEARSTIMNFFRIPLNIFVCVVLYNHFECLHRECIPMSVMFAMCSVFLLLASFLQRRLMIVAESHRSNLNACHSYMSIYQVDSTGYAVMRWRTLEMQELHIEVSLF